MNTSDFENEKRVVDEGWKQQVEREQAAARQKPTQPDDRGLPAASLESLVHMLATQALAALGVLAEEEIEPVVDRQLAKLMIDMLAVLDTKTTGNRTEDESELLEGTLYQLRMAYVQLADAPEPSTSPVVQPPKSKIILP